MNTIAPVQPHDINVLFNELVVLSTRYLSQTSINTDNKNSELAKKINASYLMLVIMAVDQDLEDVFRIPSEIGDLVRFGILTVEAIPKMINGFTEPVVDMCLDFDAIDEALELMRLSKH